MHRDSPCELEGELLHACQDLIRVFDTSDLRFYLHRQVRTDLYERIPIVGIKSYDVSCRSVSIVFLRIVFYEEDLRSYLEGEHFRSQHSFPQGGE